jgi:hypothetical protein
MAKSRHWMSKAFAGSKHGAFKAKAERAGKSTRAFAEQEKDAGGKTGKQANLALAGTNANHAKKSRSEKWYGANK